MRNWIGAAAAGAVWLLGAGQGAAHPAHGTQAARPEPTAAAASAFLATLSPEQRAVAVRPLDDAKARVNWSNLPGHLAPRDGVALETLSDSQRAAVHGLLIEALSSQGYGKAKSILWLEDILGAAEAAELRKAPSADPAVQARREALQRSRGVGKYWIVVFGEPGAARWGWMLSGHHLAFNFAVIDGRVAFTPLFKGAAPQIVEAGPYAGWRILDHEIGRAFDLIGSLDPRQRAVAIQPGPITPELFTGRGRKDLLKTPVGLSAAELSPDQHALLRGLIGEYLNDAADGPAAAQLAKIEKDGPAALRFAWWGSPDDRSERFMYRLHGPSILIEYVREPTRDGGPANHVHAIVRDPSNDYGEDWLGRHYAEDPHP